MANPTWFNFAHYKAQKLAQLQATDSKGAWTAEKMDSAFASAGFGGEDGYFAHFMKYGSSEHCSPNATFNAGEYLAAKLVQLQASADGSNWAGKTVADVQAALKAAGIGEWEHYHRYGSNEGVNPSNAFDESAYLTAKLTHLQRVDPTNWTGKDEAAVKAAFKAAGISSLEHYLQFGKGEALVAVAVPAEKQVTVPTDFNVFGGQGGMPSEGFELTRGTDTFVGGAGNDSFFAASADGFVTLNPSDSIDGGAGNDTLYIGANAGVENFNQAKIVNIENIQIAGGSIDVSTNESVVHVSNVAFGGTVTATLKQSMALSGTAAGHQIIAFKGATGAEDATTITLNTVAAKGNDLTVNNIENLTLAVTGESKIASIKDTELKNLVVKGEGSLRAGVDSSAGKIASVDATAAKGGVSLTFDAGDLASTATVKGSDANDSFVFTASALSTQKIDGGNGEDSLTLTNATISDSNKGNYTNFETLVLNTDAAGASYKVGDIAGIKNIKVSGDNAVKVTNASNAAVFDVIGTGTHLTKFELEFAEKGLASVDLNFINGAVDQAASGSHVAALTGDYTSLNLHSNGIVADHTTVGTRGAAGTSTNNLVTLATAQGTVQEVTIDGSQAIDFVAGAATKLVKVDASMATGSVYVDVTTVANSLTIKGGTGNDVLKGANTATYTNVIDGGAGDDTISGGANVDVLYGGEGNDAISGGAAGDTINGGAGNDKLYGDAGADTINGGDGDDLLVGGADKDTLTGGAGADTFGFSTIVAAANSSTITDFKVAEGDMLQFDATTFKEYAAGASVKFLTVAEAGAYTWKAGKTGPSDCDNIVIKDTAENIKTLDLSSSTAIDGNLIAIATNSGQIIVDNDLDFSSGTEIIGLIAADQAALLTAGNFQIIA